MACLNQHLRKSSTQSGIILRRRALDRRTFERYPVTQRCLYHPIQQGENVVWEAKLQDISSGGLSLVAHHAFQKGEMLAVKLPHSIEGGRNKLFVRVRHSTAIGVDYSLAGCSFVKKLSADELEALLHATAFCSVRRSPECDGRD